MSGLFLSYRRSDSARWCDRLANHLDLRFGDSVVFRDVEDLRPGVRWQREIDAALRRADVVLVLIGPSWFGARQRRRLADPKDVLRREIVAALGSPRRKVIPVLLGGASLPEARALPRPLRPLCEWQTCELRDKRWRGDVEALLERLRQLVPRLVSVSLAEFKQQYYQENQRYFALLDEAPSRALLVAKATLRMLNRVCPRYPQELELQLMRGYGQKNIAQALQRLGRDDAARGALDQADRAFRTIAAERPRDASAWNGMGSVAALRGQLEEALRYVNKALSLAPDYADAQDDRNMIVRELTARATEARAARRKGARKARRP